MKNISLIKPNRWIILSLSLMTFVIIGGISHAWFESWYKIRSGTSDIYTADSSYCYIATNNNMSNDVFVPNNTQEEIDAFTNFAPSYINLSSDPTAACGNSYAYACDAWNAINKTSSSCTLSWPNTYCTYYTWDCQTQCWTDPGCRYYEEY